MADVRQLPYRPAGATTGPIEVLTFGDLRRIDRLGRRGRPQRPHFHVLALVRTGHGRHRVDFTDAPLAPGTVVWIRPGQVNQWLDVDAVEGDLVLFTPTAVAFAADTPAWWALDGQEWALVLLAADHLRAEYDASPADPVLAELLTALLRRATRTRTGTTPPPGGPAQRFYAAVEHHLARGARLDVSQYAAQLGYAPRTLTRAVAAAAGVSAKTWLDQRTVLEAQRLLAHTGLSAAACARRLGFPDPANFSAFFARCTGSTPGRWRQHATGAPTPQAR